MMKSIKNILYFVLVLSLFTTAISCRKLAREYGIEWDEGDYKKACSNHDWDAAYEIVDLKKEKMQAYYEKKEESKDNTLFTSARDRDRAKYDTAKKEYEEAFRYVVLQEAIVTLEENGEDGIMRIVGIAKEHGELNELWLYNELLDVAKKIGDDGLVERFQKLMDSTVEQRRMQR